MNSLGPSPDLPLVDDWRRLQRSYRAERHARDGQADRAWRALREHTAEMLRRAVEEMRA